MSGSREMTLKDGDQLCNPSAFVLCRQVPGGLTSEHRNSHVAHVEFGALLEFPPSGSPQFCLAEVGTLMARR